MGQFDDLLAEVALTSEATQATQGRVPYRPSPRPLPPSMRRTYLTPDREAQFRADYAQAAAANNLDPNPDAPEHRYDYRGAWASGESYGADGHWPSQFKDNDHPNRYVVENDGLTYDTIDGRPVSAWRGFANVRPARPMPRQLRTPPTVIPRAEIDRDTAQRQAFAPPRNQIREAASMAGEMVGTEPLARGVMALRGDYTGRPEPGRAAGEFGMAAVNLGLGALGLADDVGALRAGAARPAPPAAQSLPIYRGLRTEYDGTFRGPVEWWTSSSDEAAAISRAPELTGRAAPNVLAGQFTPRNPLRIDAGGAGWDSIPASQVPAEIRGARGVTRSGRISTHDIADLARRSGYDAVQIDNVVDVGGRQTSHFGLLQENARRLADRPPTPPPRQIGRASDGSVLPVREPQPMRQSFVGGSDDLMGAARVNNRPDPHGEGVGVNAAFRGMSREEFLGRPRITTNRNAADLRPKALTSVADQPERPFLNRFTVRMSPDGAAVYDGDKVIASYNFGDTLVVDRAYRGQGIAEELVYQWRTAHPGPAVARERTRSAQRVQERVWDRIQADPDTPPGNRPPPPGSEGVGADMRGRGALGQRGIRAYHGSPHDFDRFDLSRIGTGEGAQAYGHGLYFAENEGVAREYQRRLAGLLPTDGQAFNRRNPEHVARKALISNQGDVRAAIENLAEDFEGGGERVYRDAIRKLERGWRPRDMGRMYEVNINAAPEEFLDWDAPLSGRPRERLSSLLLNRAHDPRSERVQSIVNPTTSITGGDAYSIAAQELGGRQLPEALRAAGIPGIRYLDQGSRGIPRRWVVRSQQGQVQFPSEAQARDHAARFGGDVVADNPSVTRNYVVFDDSLIEILRKYGLAGLAYGGAGGAATGALSQGRSQ